VCNIINPGKLYEKSFQKEERGAYMEYLESQSGRRHFQSSVFFSNLCYALQFNLCFALLKPRL